jgi:uridine kinase
LEKYEKHIKPNYEKYIEPTKKEADIIVPNYAFSTEETPDVDSMKIPAIDLIIKRVLPQD